MRECIGKVFILQSYDYAVCSRDGLSDGCMKTVILARFEATYFVRDQIHSEQNVQ